MEIKTTLADQLRILLSNTLPEQLKPGQTEIESQVLGIIDRNDKIAQILESGEMQTIFEQEGKLKGSAKTGVFDCIDGRLIRLLMIGRKINEWPEAGSLLRIHNGEFTSVALRNVLRQTFTEDGNRSFIEFVLSHFASLTGHGCGRVKLGQSRGEEGFDPTRETADVAHDLIKDRIAPAVEKTVNKVRSVLGLEPLQQCAIDIAFDTDTYGITLGKGQNEYSTTDQLQKNYAERIDKQLPEYKLQKVDLHNIIANIDNFIPFYKSVTDLTAGLISDPSTGFAGDFSAYLDSNYPNLDTDQRQALIFYTARTVAMQYLTGLYQAKSKDDVAHPYSTHQETYIGYGKKVPGRFDLKQVFKISASNTEEGIEEVKIALSLLSKRGDLPRPFILFIGETIEKEVYEPGTSPISNLYDNLSGLYLSLHRDPDLKSKLEKGEFIIIPVLTEDGSGSFLEILDLSHQII